MREAAPINRRGFVLGACTAAAVVALPQVSAALEATAASTPIVACVAPRAISFDFEGSIVVDWLKGEYAGARLVILRGQALLTSEQAEEACARHGWKMSLCPRAVLDQHGLVAVERR